MIWEYLCWALFIYVLVSLVRWALLLAWESKALDLIRETKNKIYVMVATKKISQQELSWGFLNIGDDMLRSTFCLIAAPWLWGVKMCFLPGEYDRLMRIRKDIQI